MSRSWVPVVVVAAIWCGSPIRGPAAARGPTASLERVPAEDQGRVVLDGRALADENGPFLALGATLFWALWGEAHDQARLDTNLSWLAEHGVDYVRILAMIDGESWHDRRIDPGERDYWPTVERFLGRLGRHGLRAQVTLFAGAQVVMPDRAEREAFVERWAEIVNREPHRFVLVEVANEHYQNGLADLDELRALGGRLASRTDVLVALSAPAHGQACAMYAGSAADLATMHYARSFDGEGPWRPVRQPWGYPDAHDDQCRGQLPPAINNEPIGPGSSVADDSDPSRLVLAYITTFVSQHAAYVLHVGAGIRGGGGADVGLGRRANLFDVPGLARALLGMKAAQAYLPPDLPNWRRIAADDPAFPFAGFDGGIARGDVRGSYAAMHNDRFVLVVLGLERRIEVAARRDALAQAIDPLGGEVLRELRVRAGEPVVFEPRDRDEWGDGFVVIGR